MPANRQQTNVLRFSRAWVFMSTQIMLRLELCTSFPELLLVVFNYNLKAAITANNYQNCWLNDSMCRQIFKILSLWKSKTGFRTINLMLLIRFNYVNFIFSFLNHKSPISWKFFFLSIWMWIAPIFKIKSNDMNLNISIVELFLWTLSGLESQWSSPN